MKLNKLITVLILCCVQFTNAQEIKTPLLRNIGEKAPELTVAKWVKGQQVNSFVKGRVYVVEFWATWCLPCIAGMPHLSAIAKEYKDEVTVLGISVMEKAATDQSVIEKFVAGMGDKMNYTVGFEMERTMTKNWLNAYGERGIPCAFIVDRDSRIAWLGHPQQLDKILPQIISGKWNIEIAATQRKEMKRLTVLDQNIVISTMNPLMGNPGNPQAALAAIDKMVSANPGLRYFHNTGHFTFWSLIKTDPEKALAFGKAWIAANDEPRFSTITDAVTDRPNLPADLYIFAADAYQAQLDRYPWSMDFKQTYKRMADLYTKAGKPGKAKELMKKAEAAPGKTNIG